jgi:hypothetical protein
VTIGPKAAVATGRPTVGMTTAEPKAEIDPVPVLESGAPRCRAHVGRVVDWVRTDGSSDMVVAFRDA